MWRNAGEWTSGEKMGEKLLSMSIILCFKGFSPANKLIDAESNYFGEQEQ